MTPNSSLRDTVGPMCRTVADLVILLDAIAGADPADPASMKSSGHIPKTYTAALKKDGLKGARLGVFRQAFSPKDSNPKILAEFEKVLLELKAAGAELIDPFEIPEFTSLPRPPQTAARFKDDMTRFLASHPGIPYPSVEAIAATKLVHPLHQAFWDEAATALPPDHDAATIKGIKDEQHWRDVFTAAFAAGEIDAIVMPNNPQPPVINGDRNTQKIAVPRPGGGGGASSTTYIGSALQWPAVVVPAGFVNGLPISLQFLGRQWDESKLIQYAYAYEQLTHHRRPPPTVPPLSS
jgi:Asp-tRNA(Asn)/Glu-tRNA(Gln) amidotransferase A subunit family amidase